MRFKTILMTIMLISVALAGYATVNDVPEEPSSCSGGGGSGILIDPTIGDTCTPVTIQMFFGFQDPYSGRFYRTTMNQILEEYDGLVKIKFTNYPFSFHENGMNSALAGECATEQGAFTPYSRKLFDNQNNLETKSLLNFAKEISKSNKKFSYSEFNRCLRSEKHMPSVLQDIRKGNDLNVTGTPTFFISGPRGEVKVVGAVSYSVFEDAINSVLYPTFEIILPEPGNSDEEYKISMN